MFLLRKLRDDFVRAGISADVGRSAVDSALVGQVISLLEWERVW